MDCGNPIPFHHTAQPPAVTSRSFRKKGAKPLWTTRIDEIVFSLHTFVLLGVELIRYVTIDFHSLCKLLLLLWALGFPQFITYSLYGSVPWGPDDDPVWSKHVAQISHYMCYFVSFIVVYDRYTSSNVSVINVRFLLKLKFLDRFWKKTQYFTVHIRRLKHALQCNVWNIAHRMT
jgi:hypothetical protein